VKIVVSIKALTKALIFIAAIPLGFQIAHQNTRWCSNTLKGSQRIGGGRNFKKFPAPLPLSRTFSNESVFSHIHLVEQNLSKAIASVAISLGVPADAKGNFFCRILRIFGLACFSYHPN
jgi:hypothetical protein